MTKASESRREPFQRQLVEQDGRWLIKSVCRRCGAVIVGSVMESLPEDEERHAAACGACAPENRQGVVSESLIR